MTKVDKTSGPAEGKRTSKTKKLVKAGVAVLAVIANLAIGTQLPPEVTSVVTSFLTTIIGG